MTSRMISAGGCAAAAALILAIFVTAAAAADSWPPYPGQRVKVTGPGQSGAAGVVSALRADSLLVTLDRGGSVACPGDGSWTVAASTGRHSGAGTGAAIGAVVAGAGGLAVGAAFASDDFFDVGGEAIVAGFFLGAAGGALAGALVGSMFSSEGWAEARSWEPIIQAAALAGPRGLPAGRIGVRLRF
jgi:hypothetical protein